VNLTNGDNLPVYVAIIGPAKVIGMIKVSERLRNAQGEKTGGIPQDQPGML
jgi:hypothetical protein